MHPGLPFDVVLGMVGRAALALERNAHAPGVKLSLDLQRVLSNAALSWLGADLAKIDMHDHNRITEDGAEAVALALAHRHHDWRVIRRLQIGDHADWLMADPRSGKGKEVALEVSGVDRGGIASRLSEKLDQVAKCDDGDQKWACVVGFEKPFAALHCTKRKPRGN